MTVREMHIEVEQSTQQVAANRGRAWLPEEIDWVLNKIQDRFIASCLRPKADGSGGFELDQLKADYIRALVTRKSLTPYIESAQRYKCFLPGNYSYLLSDGSYTQENCGTYSPNLQNRTLYLSIQPQRVSEKTDPRYYETATLMLPGLTIQLSDLVNQFDTTYNGFPDVKDWSFLVPVFMHHANITGQHEVYWEKFDNQFFKNSYVSVKLVNSVDPIGMEIDGDPFTDGVSTTKILTYHVGTGNFVNNRLSATDIIPSLLSSNYYKSRHYSPVSELEGSNLIIHRNDSFTVTGVDISYIRKPRPISLSLDSDCELPAEKTHNIICDLATEYIKATVQNVEGRQLKNADITERVTL